MKVKLIALLFLFSNILLAQNDCLCYSMKSKKTKGMHVLIIYQKYFVIMTQTVRSGFYYYTGGVSFKKNNKGNLVGNEKFPIWDYQITANQDTLLVELPFYTEDSKYDFFEKMEITFLNKTNDILREAYISKPSRYIHDLTPMPQGLDQINVAMLNKEIYYPHSYYKVDYTIKLGSTKDFRYLLLKLKSTSNYYLNMNIFKWFDASIFTLKGSKIFIKSKLEKAEGDKIECNKIGSYIEYHNKYFETLFIDIWGHLPKELVE